MGKRQRDCVTCGGPVGYRDRRHCCRCRRRMQEQAAKAACPSCGKDRVLQEDTGRCISCSRVCEQCGHPVRAAGNRLCRDCRGKAERLAAQQPCPRCGKPGYLREDTGWCGSCSRPGPLKQPPRICRECGQLRRHAGLGLCSACWQRHPGRPFIRGEHLRDQLSDPPAWLEDFVAHVAARFCVSRACGLVTDLGRLLSDEHSNSPQALLERARRPGRSMGSFARALEDFFTLSGLALPTDQAERLAAGRRKRRIDAVPEPLRPAVAAFDASRMRAQNRARRAGTRPRSNHTLETALSILRDLARFLTEHRGKDDWALIDVHDIEAFLATLPKASKRRLVVLRQFFRFARSQHIVLIDPTRTMIVKERSGFRGRTLTLDQQRELFRRWTTDEHVHPHEAVMGMLALLHGASSTEVRLLQITDIDPAAQTVRLGKRPHPVPLDPASWTVLQRCLAHREAWPTSNPHVMVTKGTKAGRSPASTAYLSHVLDDCGYPPRTIRSTRLLDLVNTMDPKLVAAAFGMDPQATLIYLADHVDTGRLPS
ncbi:site-specific integrase [Streptomyces botrytidirepellens]|uniref:Integrase n=1 Tax=Streptomyces botrytidirepellens TaxID=2486417 RepID=A0A3M8W0N4_9ACTN|nr:site-specific integrase [Streptomyces botrytidirepellens]RNG22241.1 integrase [Streptomyces botrytidirepellens]